MFGGGYELHARKRKREHAGQTYGREPQPSSSVLTGCHPRRRRDKRRALSEGLGSPCEYLNRLEHDEP